MKNRIQTIMEREGLVSAKFAEEIGVQRSAMSHILSGRNNPSLDVLIKILKRFTYVDSDWLLFGKGEMIRQHVSTQPDLFENTAINTPEVPVTPEYRKEIKVDTPVNMSEHAVKEPVMQVEKPSRNVSRIMVFYSDNTFEIFIPESKKKE